MTDVEKKAREIFKGWGLGDPEDHAYFVPAIAAALQEASEASDEAQAVAIHTLKFIKDKALNWATQSRGVIADHCDAALERMTALRSRGEK